MPVNMLALIQEYFPEAAWNDAQCILEQECPLASPQWQTGCIVPVGGYYCGSVETANAKAWGPFGLLDICWNPSLNPDSPFGGDLWAMVRDPNVNTWMASKVWSLYGWGAWDTCPRCGICDTAPGGAIPHPDGPINVEIPPAEGLPLPLILLGAAALGLAGLTLASKGDRYYV